MTRPTPPSHPLLVSPLALALVVSMTFACDKTADPAKSADANEGAATTDAPSAPTKQPAAQPAATSGDKAGEPAAQGLDRKAAEAKKAEAKKKFQDHDEAKVRAAKTKMLATLNEGRKLVKAGKLDEGMAKYQELLAIDPNYGPALGELGWAEFKAGKYTEARAHTLHALTRAPDDKRRGMLHYNLGRIAEAQDQTEVAIEAYAVSLALRPNEVVANRLAEISHVEDAAGTAFEHPAVDEYRKTHAKGSDAKPVLLPTFETAFESIEEVCEKATAACAWNDTECEFFAHGDDEANASWGLLYVGEPMLNCHFPVVKHAAGWTLYDSVLMGQYGSEIDQAVDDASTRVETNDAGTFMIIEYSEHLYERAWGWGELEQDEELPEDDAYNSEGLVICKRGEPSLCSQPIVTKYEAWIGDDDPIRYSAKVSLEGDVIVIADVQTKGEVEYGSRENEWDLVQPLPAGRYPFAELQTGG